ncbi:MULTISPECIES: hypothetical protein [unclassified Streptomyces]|uniref:hypothetical protein n=1 Tax=unclassified Streptomyces TaxID=2593676 RepID=UPI00131A3613|nr:MULTISPECIES: hypothetical protein [unclassified Streptomyces]MYQ81710.1 hypothetical protein [Streptomyces sp. SID4923]
MEIASRLPPANAEHLNPKGEVVNSQFFSTHEHLAATGRTQFESMAAEPDEIRTPGEITGEVGICGASV